MNTAKVTHSNPLRIIWTIAAKDIVDAVKNKTTLVNILFVFFLMVAYKWLPSLYNPSHTDVTIFDAGSSSLAAKLEADPQIRLHQATSVQEFEEIMGNGDNGKLGFIIPADFDQVLEAGGRLELGGYVLWDQRSTAIELKADSEQQLAELVGEPVHINIEGTIFHQPDSMGSIRMASVTLVITAFMIGVFLVPHLMLEEKVNKTMDSLLISPASASQVVTGKALAGLFYCLTIAVVVVAFNWALVVNWGLVTLTVLLSALVSVGSGLILGTIVKNKQQLSTWGMILCQPLLIPVFLSAIDPILPEGVRTALYWVPTGALTLLFRFSFSDGATLAQVGLRVGIALVSAVLVLVVVVWKVRQSDR